MLSRVRTCVLLFSAFVAIFSASVSQADLIGIPKIGTPRVIVPKPPTEDELADLFYDLCKAKYPGLDGDSTCNRWLCISGYACSYFGALSPQCFDVQNLTRQFCTFIG